MNTSVVVNVFVSFIWRVRQPEWESTVSETVQGRIGGFGQALGVIPVSCPSAPLTRNSREARASMWVVSSNQSSTLLPFPWPLPLHCFTCQSSLAVRFTIYVYFIFHKTLPCLLMWLVRWYFYLIFLHCVFSNVFSSACVSEFMITLVAFVWFLSTVYFQMWPQRTWIRAFVLTLVAFFWLFTTVHFQMHPQSTCTSACIIALVAFVCLFSAVFVQMFLQIASPRGCIATKVTFVCHFISVFSNEFLKSQHERMHTCTGCACSTFYLGQ